MNAIRLPAPISQWLRKMLGVILMIAPLSAEGADPSAARQRVYVGTYTRNGSQGIYRFEFDPTTAKATEPVLAAKVENPSFLTLTPDQSHLYCVSEVSGRKSDSKDDRGTGEVVAFAVNQKTGELTQLNRQSSGGAGPCHLVVDHSGQNVLVANYGGGTAACLPLHEDGSLKEASTIVDYNKPAWNPQQVSPRCHSINVSPDNRFVVLASLGLDQLSVFLFNAERGTLTPNHPPFVKTAKGAGPRHFTFHPGRRLAFNNNERDFTLVVYGYDPGTGDLTPLQTLDTLPAGAEKKGSTAEVQAHPNGKFVYVSNRGPNSIAIFRQRETDGLFDFAGHVSTQGKTPRNFRIDPTGKFLFAANQDSNTIVVFTIDPETGDLTPTGEVINIPLPVCIKMVEIDS